MDLQLGHVEHYGFARLAPGPWRQNRDQFQPRTSMKKQTVDRTMKATGLVER
ncbi:MAG TPA: hypothetical protein VII67_06865 [Acidimicrobiales bacterium]